MSKDKEKELIDMIKSDDLGQLNSPSGDDMPRPVASKVVEEIVEENYIRRMFPNITVPKNARNLTVPVLTYDSNNVKTIGYGTDVTGLTEQSFSTGSVILQPRLLVAYVDIIEDDLETASIDLAKYIRQTLTHKLAEAEEIAMLKGVYAAGTQTYDKVFDGIQAVANGAATYVAATSKISYNAADDLTDKIADARKALGVYGKNANQLVCLCDSTFATKLRKEDLVYSNQFRVDTDVLKTGNIPSIQGVKIIETTLLDSVNSGLGVAIIVKRDAFVVGVRKNVFFKTRDIVETFSKRIIIAEEIDFKAQLQNGSGTYEGVVELYATGS
jgi:HK97 family phage major capsid protein